MFRFFFLGLAACDPSGEILPDDPSVGGGGVETTTPPPSTTTDPSEVSCFDTDYWDGTVVPGADSLCHADESLGAWCAANPNLIAAFGAGDCPTFTALEAMLASGDHLNFLGSDLAYVSDCGAGKSEVYFFARTEGGPDHGLFFDASGNLSSVLVRPGHGQQVCCVDALAELAWVGDIADAGLTCESSGTLDVPHDEGTMDD